jgi:chromosome segregation ATPase
MANRLTSEDLKAVGEVVEEKLGDVLEAVQTGFDHVETRLTGVEGRLTNVENRLTGVERRMDTEMVTKDFLERRLSKTDGKINTLVSVLERKKVITEDEKRLIHL